jgi:hypothetical protein
MTQLVQSGVNSNLKTFIKNVIAALMYDNIVLKNFQNK